MPIRDNLRNTFKVKAETEIYSADTAISSGELLHIIPGAVHGSIEQDMNGNILSSATYEVVTNVIGDDDTVDAIAAHSANKGETVECYVLVYRTKYKDLELYPYVVLEQFTYDELRRKKLKNYVSTATSAVVNTPCNVLDQYSCDNLDKYGVRVLQKED